MSKVETVDVERLKKMLVKFNEDMGHYNQQLDSNRLGKILTIIDGSVSDSTQRKAVKDMVNNAWYGGDYLGTSPHQAIRDICEALGFELYSNTDQLVPVPSNERINQYKKI